MDISGMNLQVPDISSAFTKGDSTNIMKEISGIGQEALDSVTNNAIDQLTTLSSTVLNIDDVAVEMANSIIEDAVQYAKDKYDYLKDWGIRYVKGIPGQLSNEILQKTAQKIEEQVPGISASICGNLDVNALLQMSKNMDDLKSGLTEMISGGVGDALSQVTNVVNDAVNKVSVVSNYILMGEDWLYEQVNALEDKYVKEPIDDIIDLSIGFVENVTAHGIDIVSESCANVAADAAVNAAIKPIKKAYDKVMYIKVQVVLLAKQAIFSAKMTVLAWLGLV